MSLRMLSRIQATQKRAQALARTPTAQADAATNNLLDFIPSVTRGFTRPEHLRPLVELLERTETEEVRGVTAVPPQHTKSQTILHALVRKLLRDPTKRHGYITYATDFSRDQSYIAHGIAQRAGLKFAVDTLDRWVTPEGGGVVFAGIGGPISGRPIDGLLVVDDPIKNRLEAESQTIRNRIFEFLTSTAFTRVHPGGSIILNATRWHVDDPSGRLVDAGWEYVALPAINEDGEALWPEARPLEWLERQRTAIGPYDWASLYMQEPYVRGGRLFIDTPARYETPRLDGGRIILTCDLAASESTSADYTTFQVWSHHGYGDEHTADVLSVRRGQWDVDKILQVARELQTTWRTVIDFEKVASQVAVTDFLRKRGVRLKTHPARGDKFSRALPYAAAWNAGRIRVPLQAAWAEDFIEEHTKFTGTKADQHDDMVDSGADNWKAGDVAPPIRSTPGTRGEARTARRETA